MQLKGIFLVFLVPLPDYLKGSQTFCRFHERRIFPIAHISSSKVYSVPVCVYVCMSLVTQSYPTLYDPMDCSLLGSFAHGILQARILEWVAMPSSRASSQSRAQSQVSCNAGDVGSIPGSGRCPGRGHGNPLQYSCLENPWARSLVGYIPWGCKESDTTKVTSHAGTHSWDYVWTLYSAIDTYVCFYSSIKLLWGL